MVGREVLAIFEGKQKGAKSPKPERPRPPKYMNAVFSILAFTQTGVIAQFNIPVSYC